MTTLTLKNFPEDLLQRLKADAKRNRRSLTQEAIAQLSERPGPARDPQAIIDGLRAVRASQGVWIDHSAIDDVINEGHR